MALARIAVHHKDANKKHSILNDLKTKIATPGNEVQASLALGELGKLLDLSTVANILNTVSALFKAPDESIRIAASISIGNISVGNPDFFLSKVFSLMDAAESSQKYLFLNTIREIIINNPKSLQQFIDKLLPLLIEQSKNQDEQIRSIVAENLGRLFIHYAVHMNSVLENSFRSPSALERATITKAFKYSSTKECNGHDLGYFTEYLIKMIGDADITVRRYALESLTAITHVHPEAVRNDSEAMQANALQMTRIDPSLIKEVDLGPFKHKIDDGIPIRKAAYALIDTMVERLPERMNSPMVTEVAIRGLEDTAEECMIQSLTLIHRMAAFAPIFVITQIEALIDSFNKQFTKNIGIVGTNDKAKNVMRSIIRVVEQLHRTPEIEGVTKFADFFKEKILDIPAAKDIFQNIATTAQRAVYSEHY
ncbi:hypothetical protein FGO68_gene9894 [Halteria grandinella]|uniref:TATA-binding protein interacting (TIP20) domain-containing protein n=1 Tax=Halteria grandinella TaxID=5974 RepID=A0A8J8NE17_HALGN|nr:hypothetical protein FGO68_gene9894 [Halteria grandinella]